MKPKTGCSVHAPMSSSAEMYHEKDRRKRHNDEWRAELEACAMTNPESCMFVNTWLKF